MMLLRYCILALLILITHSLSNALPRFALRMNLKCQSCHIDPNGGGMRNYYGAAMYAKTTLPLRAIADDSTLENFTTQLNNFVSFGTDLRTIFYYNQENDFSSFYQMQGNIYLFARLGKDLFVYFNKGLYRGFEVFGLANILPLNGFIKAGRFTPAYGTKIDDHTAFIRDKTYFQNNEGEDTGIEVGISPSIFTMNVGVFNGVRENSFSTGKIRLISTRADMKFKINNLNFSLGGSGWYMHKPNGTLTMFGGFGGLSIDRATLNAELDFKKDKFALGTNELISYIELNYLVIDGIDLKFIYDYYDPDTRYKTGYQSRYSIGMEIFPINGFELRPMFRILKEKPEDFRNNEFDLLIHFFL